MIVLMLVLTKYVLMVITCGKLSASVCLIAVTDSFSKENLFVYIISFMRKQTLIVAEIFFISQ